MLNTFANQSVMLVGKFETPVEIMQVIIRSLGGQIIVPPCNPQVIVIGQNTENKVLSHFDKISLGNPNASMFVYEGKFDDYVLDGLCIGDRIDIVKKYYPWYNK